MNYHEANAGYLGGGWDQEQAKEPQQIFMADDNFPEFEMYRRNC